jgi:ComF family protein
MVNRFLSRAIPFRALLHAIESVLFTGRCVLCTDRTNRRLDMCEACEIELPWSTEQCSRCALPLPAGITHENAVCGLCQIAPPIFDRAQTIWTYSPPIAQLISAFKYQRRFSYGRVLCELASQEIASTHLLTPKPDYLVATPLHWRRHLHRGFNQCDHIATFFSNSLGIPVFRGVKRVKATPAQQSLDSLQRHDNIAGAFEVKSTESLQGRCVAVVDDVMTTGATANELSQCLLDAGVNEVHIWCLARTHQ